MKNKKWLIPLVLVGLVLLLVIGWVSIFAAEKQSGSNELMLKTPLKIFTLEILKMEQYLGKIQL